MVVILTFEEMKTLGYADMSEETFNDNVVHALDAINDLTNHYYDFHSFENEGLYRQQKYKKAVAAQIALYSEAGGNTSYAMNEPQSVSMGRTSLSYGGVSADGGKVSEYADEAVRHLMPTGLLYRGL